MFAGFGTGQLARLRQTADGLRVHLQEFSGLFEVEGSHSGGANSWSLFLIARLTAEIDARDLLADVTEFLADFETRCAV